MFSYRKKVNISSFILLALIVVAAFGGAVYGINELLFQNRVQAYGQEQKAQNLLLESKINEYKGQYNVIVKIRDLYRQNIKDIVMMLYNKDFGLGNNVGGTSPRTVPDTDEATLLSIRNIVSTMQDDQQLLGEVKHYLTARKEFADSFPFIWPTKTDGVPKLTSGFGFREAAEGAVRDGKLHMHEGVDIAGNRSNLIVATAAGKVVYIDYHHEIYGYLVIIRHKYSFETYYAHLSSISVVINQQVSKGQIVGKMGDTGQAVGVHLHYEVRRNNVAIDPMTFLSTNNF